MTIEISTGQILALIVPQAVALISGIIYVRIQLAKLEHEFRTFKSDNEKRDKVSSDLEKDLKRDVAAMYDTIRSMERTFSDRLFNMNSSLVEATTLVKNDLKSRNSIENYNRKHNNNRG